MRKVLLAVLVILASCDSITDSYTEDKNIIEVSREHNSQESLSINSEVSFVQLETTEECLLGYIMNIEITDHYIYILDRKSFYIFNRNGKFIKRIKRGRGPGELTSPMNFSIDLRRNEISIIEQGRLLHLYTLEAEYTETHLLDGSYTDAYRVDDENFLLHTALPPKYTDHLVFVYNQKNKNIVKKYIPVANLPMKNLSIISYNNFFSKNDEIFYSTPNSRNIYKYSDENMKPYIKIDFENLDPPESYLNKFTKAGKFMKESYEDNYIGFINYCYHFNEFSLVGFKYKQNNCGVIYKNDPSKLHFSTVSKLFNLPQSSSFIIPTNANKNQIHFIYYNDLLLEKVPQSNNGILEIGDKKIQVQENANPIIVTVNIKD